MMLLPIFGMQNTPSLSDPQMTPPRTNRILERGRANHLALAIDASPQTGRDGV